MFFPRLRRHAKWMFLFLALALGLGFVLFGIGAGGIGLGNLAEGGAGERRAVRLRLRAEGARQPEGRPGVQGPGDGAPGGGKHRRGDRGDEGYVALKPKDADGFRELAAMYLQQASSAQERAQIYQVRSAYLAPGSIRDTIFSSAAVRSRRTRSRTQ